MALLLSMGAMAQTSVKGVVYADQNANGKKEGRENGIANVAVTNGIQVVLTDEKGRYELPLSEDQIISVIKPSQYGVPVDGNNLPQFFYIHKPAGSPKLQYAGVAPTGKLPRSVDFGLLPREEDSKFTALIFGDPQPYTLEEVDYFARGVVADLGDVGHIPFGLSLGDLVGDDLDLFNPYIQALKEVGIPWYNLLGNHDLNFDVTQDILSDETYEAHFGPANYAFNYGNVHFIVLDDVIYPDPRDGRGYWGGFREDQLEFVKNNLKFVPKDKLVVIAFHIPISEPEGDPFRDQDREKLFDLLKDHPHTLSLSAHTHLQKHDFMGEEYGWKQKEVHHHYNVGTTSGDWYSGTLDEKGIPHSTMRDGTPKGYAFLHFDGNTYTIDYKVAGKPADYRMELFAPKVLAQGKRTSSGIYANYFLGSERDSLWLRVDDGEWKKMWKVDQTDPSYSAGLMEWDITEELLPGRRGSNAVQSTHLWRGNIPTNLEVGTHKVEVKVKDMFGREFMESTTYRLEAPLETIKK